MFFSILGPLEIAGRDLAGRKPKALLACLVLNANTMVTNDQLIRALWDGDPPTSAVANLRTYAWGIRCHAGARLRTHSNGYSLSATDDESDHLTFRRLCRVGREALDRGDQREAAASLQRALALWRGPAASGLARYGPLGHWLSVLEDERARATELFTRAHLGGDLGPALDHLRRLVADAPLHEGSWHCLIRTLAQAGEVSTALRHCSDLRASIRRELGVEPGPQLRELHRQLLSMA